MPPNPSDYLELRCATNHAGLQHGRDVELIVEIQVEPGRVLQRIADNLSARPHVGLLFDVSDSMSILIGDCRPTGAAYYNKEGTLVLPATGGVQKIEALIAAAERLVETFQINDEVSVILFSSTVSAPQTFAGANKDGLREAIRKCRSANHAGTDMHAGLAKLFSTLAPSVGRPRSAVLFTDGQPDPGTEDDVLKLAEAFGKSGVQLDVLGFGDDLRVAYTEAIATRGRGSALHVLDPAALEARLGEVVRDAQKVAITDVQLKLHFAPVVVPRDAFRARPQYQQLPALQPTSSTCTIPLGNLHAGKWQTLFVRGSIKGNDIVPSGSQGLLRVEVRFDVPSVAGAKGLVITSPLALPITPVPRANALIDDRFKPVALKAQQIIFRQELDRGDYDAARRRAAMLLKGYAEIPDCDEERESLERMLAALKPELGMSPKDLNTAANLVDDKSSRTHSRLASRLESRPASSSMTRPKPRLGG